MEGMINISMLFIMASFTYLFFLANKKWEILYP